MNFDREKMKHAAVELARRGGFIGTSSWKYPGWCGTLYDEARYVYRGKFAQTRFNRLCLAEYSEVFKTVCVDAAYYRFPEQRYFESLASQVPADFLFTFKVTDEITVRKFPKLDRFGPRAGQVNTNFLNADLFASAFLAPCESIQPQIGLLMFEFSRFYPGDFGQCSQFVEVLDGFLTKLPKGWRYGVEIRNAEFLKPEYFQTLSTHGVAHVFSSWDSMPPIGAQWAMPESLTSTEFFGARFLLKPGRKYEEAVNLFSPYERAQEINAEGRAAGARMIRETTAQDARAKGFIYVNNRFEGNALETIAAMLDAVAKK